MNPKLPKPLPKTIIYENDVLYVCLATYPISYGHTVIVWKNDVKDLHLLAEHDYLYLMDIVNSVRNALLKALKIKKVYLMYMDEVQHVHWHLVPRHNKKGFNLFLHKPRKITDYSLTSIIKKNLKLD